MYSVGKKVKKMSAEEIRKYLTEPARIEERIRNREEEIETMRSLAAKVTATLRPAPGSSCGEEHCLPFRMMQKSPEKRNLSR